MGTATHPAGAASPTGGIAHVGLAHTAGETACFTGLPASVSSTGLGTFQLFSFAPLFRDAATLFRDAE